MPKPYPQECRDDVVRVASGSLRRPNMSLRGDDREVLRKWLVVAIHADQPDGSQGPKRTDCPL
jgi:hypothetical protein